MKKNRILAVDDDRSTCKFISKTLTRQGFEVDTATDATSAIELAGEHSYDLAVLDFHMPDMDGAQLYRKLHERLPSMVAVFLTGDPTLGTVFPAMDAGAERVLAKPIGGDDLLHVVQSALRTHDANQTDA